MASQKRTGYFTGELYDRMSDDLHLAGMSQRTHEGYLRAVRQLADFCKRSPEKITENPLRKFFLHLNNDRHFASGSLRLAYSGIKFFSARSCRRECQTLAQMKIPNVKSLPEVLTIELVRLELEEHPRPGPLAGLARAGMDLLAPQHGALDQAAPTTAWTTLPARGGELQLTQVLDQTGRVLLSRPLNSHAVSYLDSG